MSTFILNLPVHVFHSLAPAVGCLGIIELSLIRVLISEMAPPDKQGKIYRVEFYHHTLFQCDDKEVPRYAVIY